jgi:hypothetical protein
VSILAQAEPFLRNHAKVKVGLLRKLKFKNMSEFWDSLGEAIKKRASNHLLGTFSIFWVICHWQFFVVLFFVDEDRIWLLTGKLKNDYLYNLLFNFNNIETYVLWIAPFILTWLLIWKFPKWFLIPAYRKEYEYKTEKRKIKIQEDKKIKELEIELEQQNIKKLDIVSSKIEKESDIKQKDPTALWKEEFEKFKKSHFYVDFGSIVKSVYEHSRWVDDGNFKIPKDFLAYSHSSGIIVFDSKVDSKIELTDKGKFFVKNYLDNKDDHYYKG